MLAVDTEQRLIAAGRAIVRERAVTAGSLDELDPLILADLIGAVDERLDTASSPDVRARLERGRIGLELALAGALAR